MRCFNWSRFAPLFLGIFVHVCGLGSDANAQSARPLKIFLNADLTHAHAVGNSIRLGLAAGLEVGARRFGGPDITLVLRDHRNNIRRTERLIDEAVSDPDTLAIVGGMHSPHYFKHGHRFNSDGLVLMLPWSAGAALTRMAEGAENYIFRVSVDDRKAATFFASRVVARGCSRVATLAIDNGWGRANIKGLSQALAGNSKIKIVGSAFVRRDAGNQTVEVAVSDLQDKEPDCVVLVLSDHGSSIATNALAEWRTLPEIFSHWGILGGNFMKTARPEAVDALHISVLSTCLLNVVAEHQNRIDEALAAADRLEGNIQSLQDVPLPMGFAHAYDAGLILSAAAAQGAAQPAWTAGRRDRSSALRLALENLSVPVEGVLKTYRMPFSPSSAHTPDGHEALGIDDLCLSLHSSTGRLVRSKRADLQ